VFGPPAWRCSRLFPPCRWSVRRLRSSSWGCSTAAVRVLLHGGFAEGVGYQVAVGLLSASYFSSVGVVPPRRMGELTPGLCASDRLGGCARSALRPRAPRYLLAGVYCAFTAACCEHRLAADCSIVQHRPGPPLTNRQSYVACGCIEPRSAVKKPSQGVREHWCYTRPLHLSIKLGNRPNATNITT
jgi:hypothetical protein